MADKPENLWLKAIRSYWADPKNVMGPPGALVRRLFKFAWLVLSVYVLFWMAGPSQVKSWELWMSDKQLAGHLAWGFTFGSAMCFAVVGYTAAATEPIKVPVFLPIFTVENWRVKGLQIRTARLHLPNVRVFLGSVLAASLFAIALLGQWNFYLRDDQQSTGSSVAALGGSTDRVGEATAALTAFNTRVASADADYAGQVRACNPAYSPTGCSRIVTARAAAAVTANSERTALQDELRAARSATVTAHQDFTDPRPVDAQMAGATGLERGLVASLLDLLRSAVVEAMLVMGAGLGLVGATSQLGVPKVARETSPDPEIVAETEPAPEMPQEPVQRRRFTLPVATEEDYAIAAVIGPMARAEPQPSAEPVEPAADPEPAEALAEDADAREDMDPLAAEFLGETEDA